MISRFTQFFETGIWQVRLKDPSLIKAILVRALRTALLASRNFISDHGQKTAAVLTYYSLLNVVPVVAVAFAVSKGFGLERLVEKQIMQISDKANLQPNVTSQILSFSHGLLEHAKGGFIAGVGVVLLLWTVISILGKIEESLNDVWGVRESRTLMRKAGDYIATMVFIPLLLIISSSTTILVTSQTPLLLSKFAFLGFLSSVILFLLHLLPYLSIWVLLAMLYLVMPNTRVPVRSAIVGGVVAGTIAQIVQWAYIRFQIGVSSYGAIYGSFAALPLFLGWLQMSWMVALFGAEIANANDHYETYGFHPDYSRLSVSTKKLLMLRVFHLVIKRFSLGEKPFNAKQLADALEIPVRLIDQLLLEMGETGLVVEIRGINGGSAFQPARTIESITLQFAIDEYEKYGVTRIPDPRSDDAEAISRCLKGISEAVEKSPANVRLKDI